MVGGLPLLPRKRTQGTAIGDGRSVAFRASTQADAAEPMFFKNGSIMEKRRLVVQETL